ncbi:SDR family oxidoreductase [Massilia sp. Se16.2.3]|uniref:SDR family oxidoreductase n=1 Tax=Massilia sp. Se16.2.3 TaxID=2709303 RepID=UPI0016009AF9|nr:SDR family oxidoreductase [Massilia sp. Se16.2.3]QNA99384.1 SDR family oxidoreductase [Massilia sp. Se16.2.3]
MKAIVTGYSKGLGAAIAAELLGRGIPVLGLARGRAPDLAARFPDALQAVELDLADPAALTAFLAGGTLASWVQGSDMVLLVNNAGVVWPVGPLAEQDPAAAVQAVTVNVAAPLALAAAAVRASNGAERRILHVSSGAGRSAYPGWSVYCATKAALDRHAEAVALDGDASVRCCSLAPGVIDTGMQAEIRATPESRFPMKERFVQLKAQGGLNSPEACACALVDYLLAPRFGSKPVDDLRNA